VGKATRQWVYSKDYDCPRFAQLISTAFHRGISRPEVMSQSWYRGMWFVDESINYSRRSINQNSSENHVVMGHTGFRTAPLASKWSRTIGPTSPDSTGHVMAEFIDYIQTWR